ncbi:MAG TPA: adenylosuccinate lyase [Candidatus Scatomorpha merdigallinarum]|nr:adenylosuccinate lyase [Candidatus Scatomorpha merdigallinarum]
MKKDRYESPLCSRYASERMQYIFSPDYKFLTWHRLWLALAENEHALGLAVTAEQVEELRANLEIIDYDAAAKYERELRHDVMAHIRAWGDHCPTAKGIIHLGATSCYVDDNGDLIAYREALRQIRMLLVNAIAAIAGFAEKNADVPVLAYTHYQAAQPTTVGKRACMWAQDLMFDLERLDFELERIPFYGCKGATGTGASFLALFGGDAGKAMELERRIASDMGFDTVLPICGQTYSRKLDYFFLSVLSGIAQSASKMATDLRLMAHEKEFDEPFTASQVGSSAMAYKRNPMRCERICSLARYVLADALNPAITSSVQWLERTLDDSANRRISIPEAFLATDAILNLVINVMSGCSIYPGMMERHLKEELPFLATENILMRAVELGGDRQELHEVIREYSVETARRMKETGCANDMEEKLLADERFQLDRAALDELLDIRKFVGMAPMQARDYINNCVRPMLDANAAELTKDGKGEVTC